MLLKKYTFVNTIIVIFLIFQQEIDEYITQAKEKGYTAVLQLGSKGVNYATNVIMQTAIKVNELLFISLNESNC